MSNPALSVEGLVKTFDLGFIGSLPGFRWLAPRLGVKGIAHRVEAVRGLTLTVETGEIYGFLGPNGAGKTTTMKMMMGLIAPTAGTGTLLGRPLGDRAARARLGFLPEHPYFYDHLKPLEFLDFYGRLFKLDARTRRSRSLELIERMGLTYAIDRPLRRFSKGMVQRIGIAQALINDPDLVVLDEPMSGLDPMGRKDVRDVIFDLKRRGKTVFFSSHILQDVEMICDRVGIVVRGKVVSEGPLTDLLDAPSYRVDVVLAAVDDALAERLSADASDTTHIGARWSFALTSEDAVTPFVAHAVAAGARLISVTPQRRSLEEVFVARAQGGEPA